MVLCDHYQEIKSRVKERKKEKSKTPCGSFFFLFFSSPIFIFSSSSTHFFTFFTLLIFFSPPPPPFIFFSPHVGEPLEIALNFVRSVLPDSEFVVTDNYQSKHNQVTHVYGKQVIKGRQVSNGLFNINVDRYGRVMNMAESFYKGDLSAPTEPKIDPLTSLLTFAKGLNIPVAKKIQLVKFICKILWLLFLPILAVSDFPAEAEINIISLFSSSLSSSFLSIFCS